MGSRGPKPRARVQDIAAEAADDADPLPPPVRDCPEAAAVFRATKDRMQSLRTWSAADDAAIARYAVLSIMHRRYSAACLAGGDIYTVAAGGYSAPTPAATGLLKVGAALLALEKALGLPYAARRELPAPDDDIDPALARFLP